MVIADAGPLIALARIGNLPDGSVLSLAFTETWLQRINMSSLDQFSQAKNLINLYQIDPGEASSMVLAQQAQAQGDPALLVMDDLRGRHAAQHAKLPMVGTAGVLLLAKQQGQITYVKPLLLDLRQNGYFLSQRLIDSALRQAEE